MLATVYDPVYYLYTGRQAIRPATYFYPYGNASADAGSVDEIKTQLAKLGVKYLIVDPLDATAKMVFASADGKHKIYAVEPK